MDKEKSNNPEVFRKDFIKFIDLKRVCEGFEKVKSFDELKGNEVFKNLFKNIADEIYIEDEVENDKEFITHFARDIFLMTKWYEHRLKEGGSTERAERDLDRVACFYTYLIRYVGETLVDLSYPGLREVFEVWIVKSMIDPSGLVRFINSLKRFYKFLEKKGISGGFILDKEEIDELKRIAHEFKIGIWEYRGEDYSDWRDENIIYYM